MLLNKNNPTSDSGDPQSATAAVRRKADLDDILERTLNKIPIMRKSLTKRESEILHFVVEGKTNKQIAQILCRAERTVEYHRNRLMKKLHARNAADLVRGAIAMGLI